MRIAIDGIVFENSYQLGIQRYFSHLITHLSGGVDVSVALSGPAAAPVPERSRIAVFGNLRGARRRDVIGRARHLISRRSYSIMVAQSDLFHTTYFTLSPAEVPTVVTVCDLIPERFPEMFDGFEEFVLQQQECLRKATEIICISHATAADLKQIYPWCVGRITPIHFGADHFVPAVMTDHTTDQNGVLFVGERKRYKNFRVIVEAISRPTWPKGVNLKVIGSPFSALERGFLDYHGVASRVEHMGRVDDFALAKAYSSARCFVFPSLAEGFGLPLIEAQQCGCPVICSDIEVFRELGGDGALYIPATDADAWATAIEGVGDPRVRAELVDAGRQSATRYTWKRCAEETLKVYQAAAAAR